MSNAETRSDLTRGDVDAGARLQVGRGRVPRRSSRLHRDENVRYGGSLSSLSLAIVCRRGIVSVEVNGALAVTMPVTVEESRVNNDRLVHLDVGYNTSSMNSPKDIGDIPGTRPNYVTNVHVTATMLELLCA